MESTTMKCPVCQFENREGVKFCEECGAKFELECPGCKANIPLGRKFCGECGYNLIPAKEIAEEKSETESLPSRPSTKKFSSDFAPIKGERKHVTVLFSDVAGYTAMSERLDPEEVKEITSRIFNEVSKIVGKYDGFIEKYAGDAVMAIFGVPKAHEDDPIRAVKVAREIHELVDRISPEVESKMGQPISMHTGINTGLVVTGEVDIERGTHGVAGDTINLASRLSNLAKPGEILIDVVTCRQVEGHFTYEYLEETTVKGKADPVQVHKVLSQRDKPVTIHRLSGLRSDLIGRKVELAELSEAVENLREGKGKIFSICGDAGTGKSRLVEEFKAILDLGEIQWFEGHAYAYTQNIPYFPMMDLFNRAFQIEESDPPAKVREKIETEIADLVGKREDVIPYVGSLYGLDYPEVEDVSPEFWKSSLREAIKAILTALARRASTVFFLEDLHWADPSFVELLRHVCLEIRQPALVLCVYRPIFNLFTSHQLGSISKIYREIRIQDLSPSEAQDMLESLLKTENIPSELRRFVREKVEGNPFYVEEVTNSLIESKILIRDNGNWTVSRPISGSDISSTIHGVLSARLDRLENETKQLLQQASVIGRSFFYKILKRVTDFKNNIDQALNGLEQLDLIRTRSLKPDLEYIFKHALTQEVVYSGLLKKERQVIHRRIGLVMEQIFKDRLPEFYEALAFHFTQGQFLPKAITYLTRSGEKSLKRYAVEEAHQFYKEAFDILTAKPDSMKFDQGLLIDIVNQWAFVFHFRGDFKGLTKLLFDHENLARDIGDPARLGMFNTLLGLSLYQMGQVKAAYRYQRQALKLGEEVHDNKVIGYTCSWLAWTYAELGQLEEAVRVGERARQLYRVLESEDFLFFNSLGGMGLAYYYGGDRKKVITIGQTLLDFGQNYHNMRSLVLGHFITGCSYIMAGDLQPAIVCLKNAIEVSADPYYAQFPSLLLCFSYVLNGQFKEAENVLDEILDYSRKFGIGIIGTPARSLMGFVSIAKGDLSRGLKMVEDAQQDFLKNDRKYVYAMAENIIGKVYLQIAEGTKMNLSMARNIKFLVQNVPFASKKAVDHLNRSIEIAQEIGAKLLLGHSYLDLGSFYTGKGRTEQARKCIALAIEQFGPCGAEIYLKQAQEAMKSLP
jgi:class 3 adenylate cyclase/tetratricopeptide (TPR) repeat protein